MPSKPRTTKNTQTPNTQEPVTTGMRPMTLLTPRQAAAMLTVSSATLDRMIRKGIVRLHRIGERGPRRFRLEDIERALIPSPATEQKHTNIDSFILKNIKK